MRVIEKKMIEAIRHRKPMSLGNTAVEHDGMTTTVRLHGHAIATLDWTNYTFTVSNCGWATVTTKSRLNALLRTFTGKSIHQTKRVWYMGNYEFRNGTRVEVTQTGLRNLAV
jgi:hypothetical protein